MARELNPPNPFARVRCTPWEDDDARVADEDAAPGPGGVEPAVVPGAADEPSGEWAVRVEEQEARTIITRNDSPDVPFRRSVNPYRGCGHGCAYCYARRTHEYLDCGAGDDFDRCVFVKVNAPELLAAEMARPRWEREQIAFSGVTDCYQPLEAKYGLTRRCLEVCLARNNPVGIVTKSSLIERDVDLLAEFARRRLVSVHLSITLADDGVARWVEPGAPRPSRRFETVRRLRTAGVPVGVLVLPIIPGLNDRDIPRLLERAAESGATSVGYGPVRLPGNVAEVFLGRLEREMPGLARRVEARIRDTHGGRLNDPGLGCRMTASGAYWEGVARLFEMTATRLGLNAGQRWHRASRPAPVGPRQLGLFEKLPRPKQKPKPKQKQRGLFDPASCPAEDA